MEYQDEDPNATKQKSTSEKWMIAFIIVAVILGIMILIAVTFGVMWYSADHGGISNKRIDEAKQAVATLSKFGDDVRQLSKYQYCEPCIKNPCTGKPISGSETACSIDRCGIQPSGPTIFEFGRRRRRS